MRGALPGETVAVELTTEKKDWARGHALDVLDASPRPGRAAVPVAPGRLRRLRVAAPDDRGPARRLASPSSPTPCAAPAGSREPVVERGGGVDPVGYRTTVRVAAGTRRRRRVPGRADPRRRRRAGVPRRPPRCWPSCCRCCASIRPSSRRCARRWPPASWPPAGTGRPGRCTGCRRARRSGRAPCSRRSSPASGCGCRWARSSSPVRRPPSCSSTRCSGRRPSSSAPGSSSTPTPASGCSPPAPPTR